MADEKVQVVYCPVCGQPKQKLTKKLYGILTCKRCLDHFALRRFQAIILDLVAFVIFVLPVFVAFSVMLTAGIPDENHGLQSIVVYSVSAVAFLLFILKDGIVGYSPGKWLLGLRVYNCNSGKPATIVDSFARNGAPALIPILVWFVLATIRKGPRVGDGLRNTKVIWEKYAHSPVFDVSPLAAEGAMTATRDVMSEPLPEDGNPFRAPPA